MFFKAIGEYNKALTECDKLLDMYLKMGREKNVDNVNLRYEKAMIFRDMKEYDKELNEMLQLGEMGNSATF